MFKKIRQTLKKKSGFSLIELLVVIAILGVISLIAVPNVVSSVNTSKYNTDRTNAASIATAITTAKSQSDTVTENTTEVPVLLDSTNAPGSQFIPKYLQSVPSVKGTAVSKSFYVLVKANKVTVYAYTSGDATKTADFTEVFPNPSGNWAE